MAYRVNLTPRAQKDVENLYRWVILRAPHQGAVWYTGLMDSIKSLRIIRNDARSLQKDWNSESR